jgi:Phage capsid family
MANQIPIAENPLNAGGYVLPWEQGGILVNGILREAGAIALAGDSRATGTYKTQFGIWLGMPTAGPVGEGAPKPVTGAEFGQSFMYVKKFASIVMFTDEMIEDVQGGDLNVLVDSNVRTALNQSIDANAVGMDTGNQITGVFDSMLRSTTQTVEYDQTKPDGLQKAVSAGMGLLEANGYGDPSQMGVLLGFGFAQILRDARSTLDPSMPIYGAGTGRDPLYGLYAASSTNLDGPAPAGVGKILGFVVHRPNIHVRIRKDVTVTTSSEATINDGTTDRHLFQENLTAVRYETRLGFFIHDENRAVVAIVNAA